MNSLSIDAALANKTSFRRKYTDAGPSFSPFQYELPLTRNGAPVTIGMESRMDKGFFVAQNLWTCYRRNYFQLSASLQLMANEEPVDLSGVTTTINGVERKINSFSVGLMAKVSSNDIIIQLVQHTPKRDKGPQTAPVPRRLKVGGSLSNINSLVDKDSVATFERLQFKSATANNGKRTAPQQFFTIVVELLAEIEIDGTFETKRVGYLLSDSIVVRGRSPGHYADTQAERSAILSSGGIAYSSFRPEMQAAPLYNYQPYSPATSTSVHSNNNSPALQTLPPPPPMPYESDNWLNMEMSSPGMNGQFNNQLQEMQDKLLSQMSYHQYPPSTQSAHGSPSLDQNAYEPRFYYHTAPVSRESSPILY